MKEQSDGMFIWLDSQSSPLRAKKRRRKIGAAREVRTLLSGLNKASSRDFLVHNINKSMPNLWRKGELDEMTRQLETAHKQDSLLPKLEDGTQSRGYAMVRQLLRREKDSRAVKGRVLGQVPNEGKQIKG